MAGRRRSQAPEIEIVEIAGLGTVTLRRHSSAKRYIIRVPSETAVTVTVPARGSFRQAKALTLEKARWIRHVQQQRSRRQQETRPAIPLTNKEKKQIAETLRRRVDILAKQYGFKYQRIFVRHQKTVWGSCSQQKNININLELHRLPDYLRDYVILHELVHTRYLHHGAAFWQMLERYVPQAKKFNRELNHYQPNGYCRKP